MKNCDAEPIQSTTAVSSKLARTTLVIVFIVVATISAWMVISHATASTNAIEGILKTYNLQNEGAKAVDQYAKKHPLLGFFVSSPIKKQLELPSKEESQSELGRHISKLFQTVREEACSTGWWSWFLINLSLLFVATGVFLDRSFRSRLVLMSLTLATISFFFVGIFAPAMVIWTAPVIPMETGSFSYVVQYEIRGIAAIIYDLFTSGHWSIASFLLLFSIVTPLVKATLTIFTTTSYSPSRNYKIGQFLHTIGKWSMADVFVAGILLSLFALKFQEATRSIPCIGLYYFIGYCLVSLTTTELLVNSSLLAKPEDDYHESPVSWRALIILFVLVGSFAAASSVFTYENYNVPLHNEVDAPSSPEELNSSDLSLPAPHK